MEVIVKSESKSYTFKDIKVGEIFFFEDESCIRVDDGLSECCQGGRYNAIVVGNGGTHCQFNDSDEVCKSTKVVIHYKD